MPHRMTRREFELAADAGPLASLRLGWPVRVGDGKTLSFIRRSDLRVLDAIWATAYVTRNYGYMVFDKLFALDFRDHRPGPLYVERREGPRSRGFPADDFEQPEERDGSRNDAPRTRGDCSGACRPWIWREGRGRRYKDASSDCFVGSSRSRPNLDAGTQLGQGSSSEDRRIRLT